MPPRVVFIAVIALVLSFAAANAATAGPPVTSVQKADFTNQSQFWTGTCGVPVFINQQGTIRIVFVSDSNVIHEVDTFPGWKVTIFSPVEEGGTGKSFTYAQPFGVHGLYPRGRTLAIQG
jgi:hypothetical protein